MDPHSQIEGGDGGRNGGTPSRNVNGSPPTPVSSLIPGSGGNPLRSPGAFAGTGAGIPGNGRFEINLTFEGRIVRHKVSADMRVSYLKDDAAAIHRLDARDLVLMLFGMNPHTLASQGWLSDPPPVGPGSTNGCHSSSSSDFSTGASVGPTPESQCWIQVFGKLQTIEI